MSSPSLPLEEVIPIPSLEKPKYHLLPRHQLDRLEDAEALYERGRRLRLGIGMKKDESEAWPLILTSAQMGHPVAQATCFDFGKGVKKNLPQAVQMYRECSDRGHPVGKCSTQTLIPCGHVSRC